MAVSLELILLALILLAAVAIIVILLVRTPKADLSDRWAQQLGQQGQTTQQALARSGWCGGVRAAEDVGEQAA